MKRFLPLFLVLALVLSACDSQDPITPQAEDGHSILDNNAAKSAEDPHPMLVAINDYLEVEGADYRVDIGEYITTSEAPEFGTTIIANNRGNKQLSSHFVPGDTRRAWSGPGSAITWFNETFDGATTSGLTPGQTAAAIRSAMGTWQAQNCSTLPLNDLGNAGFDTGVVQFILGFGGSPFVFADLGHSGFLPGAFFDAIAPGGSGFILGVTFTFVFIGGDSNGDGKSDTAFREIYYNDNFSWADDGSTNIDVETVALHEAGHGLSQGHFGKVFLDNKGNLKFAPKAVMNAVYVSPQQSLLGTDNGGHCSIWGSWPN